MKETEKLNELFDEWQNGDSGFVRDGVFCDKQYNKERRKILYILKDVHVDESKAKPPYDLRHDLINNPKGEGRTWNNIARWTIALLDDVISLKPPTITPSVLSQQMARVSAMNLKKAKGGPHAVIEEIKEHAEENHKNIRREIRICNPDLIVACGTIEELKKYIFTSFEVLEERNLLLGTKELILADIDGKSYRVVDYRHPGQGCSSEKSFLDMIEVRKFFL